MQIVLKQKHLFCYKLLSLALYSYMEVDVSYNTSLLLVRVLSKMSVLLDLNFACFISVSTWLLTFEMCTLTFERSSFNNATTSKFLKLLYLIFYFSFLGIMLLMIVPHRR
jgi:hypothetical protein